jgi:hypothetical protein
MAFGVDRLEVKSLRNHELRVRPTPRVDHPLALLDGDRHRLLGQQLDTRVRRSNRVVGMHRVRQGDVDGVHLAEAVLVLVVAVRRGDAVFPGERFQLDRIIADQRREGRVATACANAGSTAFWAIWPSPTTA